MLLLKNSQYDGESRQGECSQRMCEVLEYVSGCSLQIMRDRGNRECLLLKATKCIYIVCHLLRRPAKTKGLKDSQEEGTWASVCSSPFYNVSFSEYGLSTMLWM